MTCSSCQRPGSLGHGLLLGLLLTSLLSLCGCATGGGGALPPADPAARLAALRDRLAADPGDGASRLAAAVLLLELNDRDQAVALLEQAATHPAQRERALLLRAYVALAARDYPALLRWGTTVLDELPARPAAELALWMLRYAEGNTAEYENQVVPRLQRLVEAGQGQAGGELRWQAALALIDACGRQKDEACWDRAVRATGALPRWLAAGPYGIAPALDFAGTLPEEGRALPTTCQAPLGPGPVDEVCPLELSARDGEIRCPAWSGRGGTCLLETWVRVAAPAEGVLRLLADAAVAVELDGRRVLVRDDFVRHEPTYLYGGLTLEPGWHRLRVKLSAVGYRRSFKLFLTDLQGRPLVAEVEPGPDAPAAAPAASNPSGPGPAVRGGTPPAREWLEEAAARGERDALLFLAAFLGDFPFQDRAALLAHARELVARAPGWGEARFLLGEALRLHPDLPPRVRQSLARQEYGAALARDPAQLMAHFRLGVFEQEGESPEAALEHFSACIAQAPDYAWAYLRRFQVERDLGWDREARDDLARAATLSPSLALAREMESYWSSVDAVTRRDEARQRVLAALPSPAPAEPARWAEEAGEAGRAIGLWEVRGRFETLSSAPPEEVVRLSRAVGDRETRDRALEEWARRNPTDPELAVARARALLEDGRKDEGMAALRLLLQRYPERFVEHRLLAELEGRELGGAPPEARELLAAYRAAQRSDPRRRAWDANDMVILWESRDDLLLGRGAGFRVVHRISLIQTKQAADALGEKRIPAEGVLLEFRTIKADGRVLQPELGQGKEDLSFSGVGIGDLVEYRYVVPLEPVLAGGGFHDRFFFGYTDRPIHQARLEVCLPREAELAVRTAAFAGSHEQLDRPAQGLRCERWSVQGVDGVVAEPWSSPYPEWLPWVAYGYRLPPRPQDEVARALGSRLRANRRPSPELAETVALLLADPAQPGTAKPASVNRGTPGAALANEDKARRLHAWVRDEVRSGGYEAGLSPPAAATLAERKGNRTVLLSALLELAGVPHRVLLARSRELEQLEPPLPDPGWFRWPVIEVARPGREPLLLDPVTEKAPAGYVPPELAGAAALVLSARADSGTAAETTTLAPGPQDPRDRWQFDLDLRLAEDGRTEGVVTITGEGGSTRGVRSLLPGLDPKERLALAERLLSQVIPGVAVQSLKTSELDEPDRPLRLTIGIASRDLVEVAGPGRYRIPRLLAEELAPSWAVGFAPPSEYLRRMERKLPLLIQPLDETVRLTLTAPGPIAAVQGAADLSLDAEGLSVSQRATTSGARWTLERRTATTLDRVPPERFLALRQAILQLGRARTEAVTIALQEPGGS